ncbi:MAG: acetate--CoA ligase family protein [Rickettsiales bacterium]|jgi:acetyltransferase|nr:acetate--CoA ligase family protein [Rickettsiales bacterium]
MHKLSLTQKLRALFKPKTVAVVGVSNEPTKLGSVIFNNLIEAKYKGTLYAVNPKNAGQKLYGRDCFASVVDIPEAPDLVIVVVPTNFVANVVKDCADRGAKNISIITSGFAEVGNHYLESQIANISRENGMNLLGPNCLGHIATYSSLNASFADGFPKRGKIAFISQSGAYCSAMLDWAKENKVGFSYFISTGNKAVLSEIELLKFLKNSSKVSTFVFYLESLKNGQEFIKLAKDIIGKKQIIVLEPGKSSKAQTASLSHTGSLAPNYRVLETAFREAGIVQVYTSRDMFGLVKISQYCKNKEFNGKLAIITNAGGVGVLASDLCEENGVDIAKPSSATIARLKTVLPSDASCGNPIDIIGDARADRYDSALRIICESGEYANVLVLLTPQMVTDPIGTAKSIVEISKRFSNINIFTSFIGGKKVNRGTKILKINNIMDFEYPDDVIKLIGILGKQRDRINSKNFNANVKIKATKVPENIRTALNKAKEYRLKSLPHDIVNMIIDHYEIDYPRSGNFIEKKDALDFCEKLFPSPVVLKMLSPDAIHKTEMKGVYLNVNDEKTFDEAWEGLMLSLDKFNLRDASILVQEMITKSVEVIIGVNSDQNFGKLLVFGSGGIYTEVINDTNIKILPVTDFDALIKDTKVGTILGGVRGEPPRAVKQLVNLLEKIQQLVVDLPQIQSIHINPALITEDRALVDYFKILI